MYRDDQQAKIIAKASYVCSYSYIIDFTMCEGALLWYMSDIQLRI